MLADALMKFSQFALAGLLASWSVITLVLPFLLRRMARSHRTIEATARCVETEYPELGSDLINVVQLAGDRVNESRPFCEAAVNEAAALARGLLRFEDAADRESRWRRFLYCMQTPRASRRIDRGAGDTFWLGLLGTGSAQTSARRRAG